MEFDVIIVGAGPIGGYLAELISNEGYDVALLEEHREIGEPVHCAGLVTPRVFDFVSCRQTVLNEVRGAEIYSPEGHEIRIDGKEKEAVVINRSMFDREIVKAALKKGAYLFLGATALKAERKDRKMVVHGDFRGKPIRIEGKILIGADGVKSNVAKWFGLSKPEKILPGFEAEMANVNCDSNFVKIFVGNNIAPGFFSWIIPANETARVGLCIKEGNAYAYFERMFTRGRSKEFLELAEPLGYFAGAIPVGLSKKTYDDNVMIVGDAASQVKATSGGGIYTGLACAKFCAETAIKALESRNYHSKFLSNYQKLWMEAIGKELKRDLHIHKAFASLTDAQLEEIFDLLDREELLDLISEKGDIDFPSELGFELLKKEHRFLKFAGPALKSLLQ